MFPSATVYSAEQRTPVTSPKKRSHDGTPVTPPTNTLPECTPSKIVGSPRVVATARKAAHDALKEQVDSLAGELASKPAASPEQRSFLARRLKGRARALPLSTLPQSAELHVVPLYDCSPEKIPTLIDPDSIVESAGTRLSAYDALKQALSPQTQLRPGVAHYHFPRNLQDNTGVSIVGKSQPHALSKHLLPADEDARIAFLAKQLDDNPRPKFASGFYDERYAEHFARLAFVSDEAQVRLRNFLHETNPVASLVLFSATSPRSLGMSLDRKGNVNTDLRVLRVVVKKGDNNSLNIQTAYPVDPETRKNDSELPKYRTAPNADQCNVPNGKLIDMVMVRVKELAKAQLSSSN